MYLYKIEPISFRLYCRRRVFYFGIFTGAEVSDKNPEKQIKNRGRKKE